MGRQADFPGHIFRANTCGSLPWPTPSFQPGWAWLGLAPWAGRYVGEAVFGGSSAGGYPYDRVRVSTSGPYLLPHPLPMTLLSLVSLSSVLSPALCSGSMVQSSCHPRRGATLIQPRITSYPGGDISGD